jgi:hypothetical protein
VTEGGKWKGRNFIYFFNLNMNFDGKKTRKGEVASACADTAFKYASPEHTGRTGNSVDLRSDVSFFSPPSSFDLISMNFYLLF